jgi:hypothetical protein
MDSDDWFIGTHQCKHFRHLIPLSPGAELERPRAEGQAARGFPERRTASSGENLSILKGPRSPTRATAFKGKPRGIARAERPIPQIRADR